jgi:phospholipase C
VSIPPHQGQRANDIEHQWAGAHISWNPGANNNWMTSHITSEVNPKVAAVTMGYYDRRDLPL